jgi:activator of HSP90 ATPase
MAGESFEVSTFLPAPPWRVYEAWLDGTEHGLFTGGPATGEPAVGGAFTAWDGYIQGRNLALEPYCRIVQAWRTTEFPAGSPDSCLEVLLDAEEAGTRLTLRHSEIPEGQGEEYKQGWLDYYFEPMREYFAS